MIRYRLFFFFFCFFTHSPRDNGRLPDGLSYLWNSPRNNRVPRAIPSFILSTPKPHAAIIVPLGLWISVKNFVETFAAECRHGEKSKAKCECGHIWAWEISRDTDAEVTEPRRTEIPEHSSFDVWNVLFIYVLKIKEKKNRRDEVSILEKIRFGGKFETLVATLE